MSYFETDRVCKSFPISAFIGRFMAAQNGLHRIESACLKASWHDLMEVYLVRSCSRILLPVCLLASVVSTGQTDAHDLKITTRHGSGTSEFTTTTYYRGENSRSEIQIVSGNVKGHHRAIIRQEARKASRFMISTLMHMSMSATRRICRELCRELDQSR